jgi:NAD(P)-dependent dehydrogenase (short-subunit alcohol dehydrogenase family)
VAIARTRTQDTPADATFLSAELRDADAIHKVADSVLEQLGEVDIPVKNAGVVRPFLGASSRIPDDEWLDSFDINLGSAVRLTNALLPSLKDSSSGVIVNVSALGNRHLVSGLVHSVRRRPR